MPSIPRDPLPDSTLALLSEGYRFIPNRCDRFGSDIFETRLMLTRAICMRGAEAAQAFYAADRFTRKRAIPKPTLKLLQDVGSVQLLEGDAHRSHKRLFMSLMTPPRVRRLADIMADEWRARVGTWETRSEVAFLPEAQEILCRAVCARAGVPLDESEARQRTREFAAMTDGAGAVGPRNWRGLVLRQRTERRARDLVERIRGGRLDVPPDSAAHLIASHRDADGAPLDSTVSAVELLNVLRPTVAVGHYVMFAALALHEHPKCRRALLSGSDADDWNRGAFDLIPQGGGDFHIGHRCPGERITIELTERAIRLLAAEMRYDVPSQDLGISLSRIPALPKSRFVIKNVRHVRA